MFFQFLVSDYEIMNIRRSEPNKKEFHSRHYNKRKKKSTLSNELESRRNYFKSGTVSIFLYLL